MVTETGLSNPGARMGKLVVYIDDNETNRTLFEMIAITIDDVDLRSFITAEEALPFLNEHQPVLILMDINLPGMSGIEAITRCRQMEHLQSVSIYAVSADQSDTTKMEATEAGANRYYVKPVDVMEIKAVMQEAA